MLNKFRLKEITSKKLHWSFLPLWIVATSLSYAGGGKVSAFVTDYITNDFGVFLSFAVMSLAIAIAQWLVIRRHIRGVGWLWTTLVGGSVGGALSSWASFQLAVTYGEAVDLLAIYACLRGFSTGFMQWTLIKHHFKRSGWWIVGTTGSWYVGVMVGSLLMNKLGYFLTLVVGAIYGLLTGITLLLFFWDRFNSSPISNK
ncbi:hypothetical protein [Pseudanabaena sp. SR411]|uniref:hypothetical protein n=1 Tax=Pseudanabaena sp. SR411 TaxID=1980935 RepID=UPI0011403EC7|nr:hypothetical protein [Pseudanabaena sp. SR411]